MSTLNKNLRFSWRMLSRNPGMTLTVLLTLALGVGANTAIFTVDYATMLQPLPYPDAKQLVIVWSKIQGFRNVSSVGDFLDWERDSHSFQSMAAWTNGVFNLASGDHPQNVSGLYVTPGYYRVLGLPMFLGREFLPREGHPGQDNVVILSHRMWKRLGGDRDILGKTLTIDDEPRTVVGVLPAGVYDREEDRIVVPLAFTPEQENHGFHWLLVMGRLKPGVSLQQAQADMDAVTAELARQYPKSNQGWGVQVEPLKHDFISKDEIKTLWLLLGAVGFVLLIACLNVANLLMARSMARQREMAIRAALGAGARAIFAQLLVESLMLAVAGGAMGLGVGYAMLQGLMAAMPSGTLPSEAELTLNVPVLAFTLAATTLAGLLFGCIPAWSASRVDPAEAMKEGGRAGSGVEHNRLRRALVVGEFALALALLAGAGLAFHSFWNLAHVDTGVRANHALTFDLAQPDSRPKDPATLVAYYHRVLASIDTVPGVQASSVETGIPMEGPGFGMPFTIVGGRTYADPSREPTANFGMVSPDYFKTFGILLEQGRTFTEDDTAESPRVAMVNEKFVQEFLKGKDPLQQQVEVSPLDPRGTSQEPAVPWQIVGVYHTVRSWLRGDRPEILVPFWQDPWASAGIGVRTVEDPATMLNSIAAAVHRVDPLIALDHPQTMVEVHDHVLANDRFTLLLYATFAAIALLLAAVGIYGVMRYSVEQRSHEIALRMALGATRGRVVRLIVLEGLVLAVIGLGVGLVGAYFIGRAMESSLYGVSAMDYRAFAAVGAVLMVAALAACGLPALRAASTEPMKVLRTE